MSHPVRRRKKTYLIGRKQVGVGRTLKFLKSRVWLVMVWKVIQILPNILI